MAAPQPGPAAMVVAEQPFGCSRPVSSLELRSHSTTIRNAVAHATAAAIRVRKVMEPPRSVFEGGSLPFHLSNNIIGSAPG
jgi:hypothetical protein